MAFVRVNIAQFENATCYVDVVYDNVTGIVRDVIVRNRSGRVLTAQITMPDGQTRSIEFTHLPGPADDENSRRIPVPLRPQIDTMSTTFNLKVV